MLMSIPDSPKLAAGRHPAPAAHGTRIRHRSWLQILLAAIDRRRQRIALANLDDRLLEDIGVTRAAAAREAGKPFWR